MELDNWIRSVAERRWPILPNTLHTLREQCSRHNDHINFTDLANLVLSDPLLLFDLLRVIGSSQALQRAEGMPSIEQSIILIGLEGAANRFTQLTALDQSDGHFSADVLEAISLWLARSRVAALIVKGWLSIADEPKVEDCFVAALIYNLPACFYLMYRNALPDRPLLQQVAASFDIDYPKLLEQFVRDIPLPAALLGLLSSGPTSSRKQILRLAVATANSLEGHWRSPWVTGVETVAQLIGAPFDKVYRVIPEAVLQVARHSRAPGYGYPARELLFLPQVEGLKATSPDASSRSRGGITQSDRLLQEIAGHLSQHLKFERVLCWRYVTDPPSLQLACQIGLAEQHPLRQLTIDLNPGSFFALLASKSQSFHANPMVCAKLRNKYKDVFFQHIGDHEFAIMTVFVGQTLVGVVYVDCASTGGLISEELYQQYKELVTRITHRL